MFAYIDAFCLIAGIRILFPFGGLAGYSLEDFFQSTLPCIFCILEGQLHIAVTENRLCKDFTNYRIGDGQFTDLLGRNFCHDAAEAFLKEISLIHRMFNLHAKTVSEGHLAHCCCQAIGIQRIGSYDSSSFDILMEFSVLIHHLIIFRKVIFILLDLHKNQFVSCFLKLRSHDILITGHIHCEGYQCRRNIDLVKTSGHTVLTTNGGQTKAELCAVSAQKGCKGLAPAFRIFRHAAEILLEGETDLAVISTNSHNAGYGFQNCIDCSVVRAPAGKIGIETIAHHGNGIGLSFENRKLRYHGLGLSELIFSAVRHQNTACTDGTVEHFHQSLLGAAIQIFQRIQPFGSDIGYLFPFEEGILFGRNLYINVGLLMSSVRIQEGSGDIYDLFSSPYQNQTRTLGHDCNFYGLQVLLLGIFEELIHIFRIHNDCHTLLRLGNGNLGSVKTCIFFRHLVEVDTKARSQLSDGNRDTARTEVVTFLNQAADLRATEHTLDLTLSGSITFLHLCAADLNGSLCMYFGRTGSSADSVTAGPSAQKNDDISRIRIFSFDSFSRSCAHNCADLHTLCHIIRMINFFYITGSQTDLVSIGAIAVSCAADDLLLRQFAFQRLLHRYGRISSSGHTHGLIYIGTA